MKQTKILATLQATSKTNSDGKIHGIANSLSTTRDGTLVTQAAGEKVIGKTVPLLLSHDWDALPIGSVTMSEVKEDGLHYEGEVFQSAPNREQILEGINSGVLAVSVGFLIQSMDNDGAINDIDLLELSITPVPADAKATVTQELEIDAQAEPEDAPASDEPSEDAPTIQDVLDALNELSNKVDKILDAVAPDEEPANDEPNDNEPAPEPEAKQTLDNLAAGMLELSHDKDLAVETRVELNILALKLKGETK